MAGNTALGAVLRELRVSRKLTLVAVARRIGCAESLLCYIETGQRQLQRWLAECLDDVYCTGGAINALLDDARAGLARGFDRGEPLGDLLLVRLPEGGITVPVSRRQLLASLGIGVAGGSLLAPLEHAVSHLGPTEESLTHAKEALDGFQAAARTMAPSRLIDALTGQIAVVDGLRRSTRQEHRTAYTVLQSRYAEFLGWMSEEAGDLNAALYWTDRAAQWAHSANWWAMVAYTFVRRSMMAISFANDGWRAVENAESALSTPNATPRIKGLAATEMALGYALVGRQDDAARALDSAMLFLEQPAQDNEDLLGQRSVTGDDLFTIYRATCDIYLGKGDSVIPVLEPRLAGLTAGSQRRHTITRAKIARAYANAGQPADACRFISETLEQTDAVDSLTARSQLHRTVPVLRYWRNRTDVREILHRLCDTQPAGNVQRRTSPSTNMH